MWGVVVVEINRIRRGRRLSLVLAAGVTVAASVGSVVAFAADDADAPAETAMISGRSAASESAEPVKRVTMSCPDGTAPVGAFGAISGIRTGRTGLTGLWLQGNQVVVSASAAPGDVDGPGSWSLAAQGICMSTTRYRISLRPGPVDNSRSAARCETGETVVGFGGRANNTLLGSQSSQADPAGVTVEAATPSGRVQSVVACAAPRTADVPSPAALTPARPGLDARCPDPLRPHVATFDTRSTPTRGVLDQLLLTEDGSLPARAGATLLCGS